MRETQPQNYRSLERELRTMVASLQKGKTMALKQLGPREIAVSSPDDMGADEDEERAAGITP